MSTSTFNVRLKNKYDTESNWSSKNPVLLKGELGFTSDGAHKGNYKIGDGTSAWKNLSYAVTTPDYIASRGENLVTNGTCLMGDNTNFKSYTFDGTDTYYASGCFKYKYGNSNSITDENIPVDVNQAYNASYYIKSNNKSAIYYFYILMFDIDKKEITASNVMWFNGSTTKLAKDLKNGDTVVYLESTAGFDTKAASYWDKGLIFWNYKNSYGYQYPVETYSRNVYQDLWANSTVDINNTNNTITLKSAWTNGTFPAGTSVSQSGDGATYTYLNSNFTLKENTWTRMTGTINGVGKNNEGYKFREGTAFVKLGWINGYHYTGDTQLITSISTISFSQKSNLGHTHNYAGATSSGGSATSAVKLDITTAGSATQPVYFTGGKPVACDVSTDHLKSGNDILILSGGGA